MKQKFIHSVLQELSKVLDSQQLDFVENTLEQKLLDLDVIEQVTNEELVSQENEELLTAFLSAKKIEGCSAKTIKYYKSSGGKMIWNDKLKRQIPEGWHCGTLLDIAIYTNGLACQKFRPTDENKLPVIKIKEMHDGISPDTEFVKSDIPEAVKVYDGDVLFSWSASLEVMLWAYGDGGLNQHIFKVTSKNNYPRSFYFYQLIDYIGNFKRMAEARKTTMGHITQDHLKQSTIALPPNADIANKLEERLLPVFDAIITNSQEIMNLTKQRDELLPLLMNGQVSVNYHLSDD